MPDLFVVMNDEELREAIEFAKEQGATSADIVENIQYSLSFDEIDAINYCRDGNWFPHFSHYIRFKVKDNDEIGMLLSSTVWNDFDLNKLYGCLEENGITAKTVKDKWFDPESVKLFNEQNRKAAKIEPINSPWTARDNEVVCSALDSIEGINKVKIIKGANVRISVFTYLRNMTSIPTVNPIVQFDYPNVMHLDTTTGEYNVFMGGDIQLDEVKRSLVERGLDFGEEAYEISTDPDLILYKNRSKDIWNEEKGKRLK